MKNLIFNSSLNIAEIKKKVLSKKTTDDIANLRATLRLYDDLAHNGKMKEEQLQSDFLTNIFVQHLGYCDTRDNHYNLEKEVKTNTDSTKADGVLGFFNPRTLNHNKSDEKTTENKTEDKVLVAIELKGSHIDLDKKVDAKSPVEQAFSYAPKFGKSCKWVIVSNFKEIRLYSSNDATKYQVFNLANITYYQKDDNKTEEGIYLFVYFFLKDFLIGNSIDDTSEIESLLLRQPQQEKNITNEFYNQYAKKRITLFEHICQKNPASYNDGNHKKTLLQKTQKLLDRIIFILFCENYNLLQKNILTQGYDTLNFKRAKLRDNTFLYKEMQKLFEDLDKGSPPLAINKFNGGLFAEDILLDTPNFIVENEIIEDVLELTQINIASDLSVNILGHIFEQSLTDLEELEKQITNQTYSYQQSQQKKQGIYYTPEHITSYIVEQSLNAYLFKNVKALDKLSKAELLDLKTKLLNLKILDLSCGSGAFLVQVFKSLSQKYQDINESLAKLGEKETLLDRAEINTKILNTIYGVDLNDSSVEITKLSLWVLTAQKDKPLNNLDDNIKCGNSLISQVSAEQGYYYDNLGNQISKAFIWKEQFKDVMQGGGFDIVIGNPPYVRQESIKEIKPYLEENYKVYNGSADLYTYFYEQGLNLLKQDGILAYITSNKWMRTKYGQELRELLLQNTLIQMLNLGSKVFENATVDSNILIVQKTSSNKDYNFITGNNLIVEQHTLQNSESLSLANFLILNQNNLKLKEQIEKLGTPLKDWDVEIYRGILTGFNEAFIIDEATKNKLITTDSKSAEIIKPILRGKDINRYSHNYANLYLIATHNGYKLNNNTIPPINIEDYKAIKQHLDSHKTKINARSDKGCTAYNLRDCAYWEDFEKEKIVWAEIDEKSSFTLDSNNYYLTNTAYCLTSKYHLKYLLSILNSNLASYFFTITCGLLGDKGLRHTKQYIEKLPIIKPSKDLEESFNTMADQMLSLHKELDEINASFINLYVAEFPKINHNKLKDWYKLSWESFLKINHQNNSIAKHLSGANKEDWYARFNEKSKQLKQIYNQITENEKIINQKVYNLYQLNQEQIDIIENNIL